MISPRTPNESDKQLGADIRRMREGAGLTQAGAAEKLGVSMQQYGKYERGENRISAARYDELKRALRTEGVTGMAEEGEAFDADTSFVSALRRDLEQLRSDVDHLIRKLPS